MSNLIYKWASKYVNYKNRQDEAKKQILKHDIERVTAYIKSSLISLKIKLISEFEKTKLRNIKPGDFVLLNEYNFLDSRNKWDSGAINLMHYKVDQNMPSYVRVKSIEIATDYYDYLVDEFIQSLSYEDLKQFLTQTIVIKEFNKYCTHVKKSSENISFYCGVLYRKLEFDTYENFKENITGHVGMSEYTFLCKDDLEYNLTKEVLTFDKKINNYEKQIDEVSTQRNNLINEYKEKKKK